MNEKDWTKLLRERKVDERIVALLGTTAENRALAPPTTDTEQLLIAVEPDGYAAGRVGGAVLSLFFDPDRAHRISEQFSLSVSQRSQATWIVRLPAAELDDPARLELAGRLLAEALDRVEPLGSWNRGLPDAKKVHGDICPTHSVQRSVSGDCYLCD
jgi:hypothetical protein